MYVKLYNKILDSSIAEDRRLRHFFIDLLLLADQDGNVVVTKKKIADRTGASMEEVEWGLSELMKPEGYKSHTLDNDGRRIEALEGCGYGWKILNYAYYRDCKSAKELRDATKERVQRHREKKRLEAEAKAAKQESSAGLKPDEKEVRKKLKREWKKAEREAEMAAAAANGSANGEMARVDEPSHGMSEEDLGQIGPGGDTV